MVVPSFSTLHFAFRWSSDGLHFFRIGQAAGPDGGAPRTLVRSFN